MTLNSKKIDRLNGRLIEVFQKRRNFAYLVLSPELKITSTSPNFIDFIRRDVDELVGMYIADVLEEFVGGDEALYEILDGQRPYICLENLNFGENEAELRYLSFSAYALNQERPGEALVMLVEDMTQAGRLRQQIMQDRNLLRLVQIDLERANQTAENALAQARCELAERKRAETALRTSQELLGQALDIAHMAAWELEIGTCTLNLDDQLLNLLGISVDRTGSRQVNAMEFIAEFVYADDLQSVMREVEQAERVRNADYKGVFEVRLLCRERGLRHTLLEYRLQLDECRHPWRAYGYVMDITERKQAEQALEQRTQELEAALKELNSFSYSVSHDLRSPLRALYGYSKILLEQYSENLDEGGRQVAESIRMAAQRMDRLIEELLKFSRASQKEIHKEEVEPSRLASQAYNEIMKLSRSDNMEFVIRDLPPCWADPTMLYQVFINLLSNAIKFSAKRDPARIEVDWRQENGATVYFVRDNGVGFDINQSNQLFGIFQRLHNAAEFEGSGLGLAIVQRIIHRHGGRVWAEAAPDRGATFYFTLGE